MDNSKSINNEISEKERLNIQIQNLIELRDMNVITKSEFESKKHIIEKRIDEYNHNKKNTKIEISNKEKLLLLEEAKDEGLITQDEYTNKRNIILNNKSIDKSNSTDIKQKNKKVNTSQTKNNKDTIQKKSNKLCLISFILGILSIFIQGLFAIAAVVTGIWGLNVFDKKRDKNKWQGYIGLILGILYTLVYLYRYGYII